MVEKPILFKDEMIRAILERRKTVTRRVIQFKVRGEVSEMARHEEPYRDSPKGDLFWSADHKDICGVFVEQAIRCPYDADRLWVRENHTIIAPHATQGRMKVKYHADGAERWKSVSTDHKAWKRRGGVTYGRGRPNIHMFRWSSDILLGIKSLRAERVQEITAEDCLAEGISLPSTPERKYAIRITGEYPPTDYLPQECFPINAPKRLMTDVEALRAEFASLWDRINASRGFSWKSNPWVWRVEFPKYRGDRN